MEIEVSLNDYPDLTERVYQVIKDRILSVRLVPGSQLLVGEMARRLGVSRTPVKEALSRLSAEGLIEDVPRKGYFVAKLEGQAIADLLDARLVLELAAVERGLASVTPAQVDEVWRLVREMEQLVDSQAHKVDYVAFMQKDSAFHLLIVGNINNQRIVDIYRTLHLHLYAVRMRLAAEAGYRRTLETLQEHRAIAEALEARDLPVLKVALAEHMRNAARRLTADN